ncbi:glycoside hydrolase superfamily, partial [Hyaloscypha sp. PMI_1271]
MFSTKSLAAATAAFALFTSSTADYNPAGKGNTAVYWGAGGSQKALTSYCYDQSIDIIPVGFINSFPAQANGLQSNSMADNQAGYIAAINQLRILFAEHNKATGCNKQYLITGAPQCPFPDAQMSDMINGAQFDIVWPQFYNNPACSARNWVTNNNAGTSGFNFNKWQTSLATGASKDAQLYIGLLGGPQGTSATYLTDYLNPTEAKNLIGAYAGQSKFGGVMLWDAVSSDGSVASLTAYTYRNGSAIPASAAYYDVVKDLLGAYANSYTASAPVCTTPTSSTSSSTSTSSTSSSVST